MSLLRENEGNLKKQIDIRLILFSLVRRPDVIQTSLLFSFYMLQTAIPTQSQLKSQKIFLWNKQINYNMHMKYKGPEVPHNWRGKYKSGVLTDLTWFQVLLWINSNFLKSVVLTQRGTNRSMEHQKAFRNGPEDMWKTDFW